MQHTKTVTLDINGSEVEAELTFNHTPFSPGFYSGPPEDCYPCEPEEFDLLKLRTEDGDNCDWMLEHIGGDLIDQIREVNL